MLACVYADSPPAPLVLVGPTASGKSAVSLFLAQHYPLEIISVDSALVYQGMDIGTAKPSAAELAQVPHHLIDIRDPSVPYSTAEFVADAQRLMADIQSRGKRVLLVGGTMLYVKALLYGLDDLPSAQPALRADLEAQAQARGWAALHAELAQVDPVTAHRLSPNDSQRIGRALEVYRISGRPLSSFHSGKVSGKASPCTPVPVLSLEPQDRAWLHQRIAQRFELMLNQGLLAEVLALRHRPPTLPPLHADLPSLRCVGYRQVWEALAAHQLLDNSELEHQQIQAVEAKMMQEILHTGTAATRQLAKRQLTWLRGMPERQVITCDAPDLPQRVLACVRQHWG